MKNDTDDSLKEYSVAAGVTHDFEWGQLVRVCDGILRLVMPNAVKVLSFA